MNDKFCKDCRYLKDPILPIDPPTCEHPNARRGMVWGEAASCFTARLDDQCGSGAHWFEPKVTDG